MNNLEHQKKAENLIKEKKWDFYLIDLFLRLRHLPSSNQKIVYSGYTKKYFDVHQESFKNINFEIGGFVDITYDGHFQSVVLYINTKLVLHVKYQLPESAEYFESDKYKVYSVEEFHNDSVINELLIESHESFRQKRLHESNQRRIKEEMLLKNKFTFD
jgi:hypothetical protein